MSHSHKNTSEGGREGRGNSGPDYIKIKENIDPKPPAGASNSYEKVREKIDRHDESSLAKRPYTREKMANK
jgi:hypothetical protein